VNISEEKIRKVIKHYLVLSEAFTVDEIPLIKISDCDLRLPAGKDSAALSKTANDIADLYGVPGSFCAVIASMIPGASTGPRSGNRNQDRTRASETEQIEVLSSVKESLQQTDTLFLNNVNHSSKNDPTNANALREAQKKYEEKLGRLGALVTYTDPLDIADKIVDDIFEGYGSGSDVRSKIKKWQSIDGNTDRGIVEYTVGEARTLMRVEAESEIRLFKSSVTNSEVTAAASDYLTFVQAQ
jgi:hypothetical protein